MENINKVKGSDRKLSKALPGSDLPCSLILSRNLGQEILVGGDVKVRVIQISRGQVKIMITAPGRTEIVRSELIE
jgi:carbon storage regulator CsrA